MDEAYQKVIEKIEKRRRFGAKSGREVSEELLRRVGHPEEGMRIIHIAGTNGKGSTAAFLDQILRKAEVKVGMFTSPHLISFRERIKVDGRMIEEKAAARIGQRLLDTKMPEDLTPTFFDLCLAMALLYFKEQECEVVILETGLGGRLDSTRGSITVPLVSVITAIGLDHTSVLGSTLQEIAGEKAGILRQGTRAVLAQMADEAAEVLVKECNQNRIPWIQMTTKEYMREKEIQGISSYPVVKMLSAVLEERSDIKLGLYGDYQWQNAANALGAIAQLCCALEEGEERMQRQWLLHELTEAAIREGLRDTQWPGRAQILRDRPLFMVDGAHNPQGVKALADTLKRRYPGEKFHFFTGVLSDKDYRSMMKEMLPLADSFDTVSVDNLRTLEGEKLAKLIRSHGITANYHKDIKKAMHMVLSYQEDHTAGVVAFGSLYFIGEILGIWKKMVDN